MPRFDRRPSVPTGLPCALAGAAGLALAGLLLAAATASVDPPADEVVTGLAAPASTASATESIPAAAAAPLLPDAGTALEAVAVPTAGQTLVAESVAAEPAALPAAAEPAASTEDDVPLEDPELRPGAGELVADALPPPRPAPPVVDPADAPTEREDVQAARTPPPARSPRPRRRPAAAPPAAPRADSLRAAPRAVLLGRPAPALFLPRPEPLNPPALPRLAPSFAARLARIARAAGVEWELVLAVLRARGHTGPRPATTARLRTLAATLAAREHAPARRRSPARAEPGMRDELVRALVCFHRAVGLAAFVRGLADVRERLTDQLLHDRRVWIYPGGRDDLRAGAVDVRVVAVLLYLAEQHGQITVSSLRTGHRVFARPGIVSAHALGRAVDIAAVAGRRIAGALGADGRVERLVRSLLVLPRELRPSEVISLLALGGPSFALADHGDHVHVGY